MNNQPLVEDYNPEWSKWFRILKQHTELVLVGIPHCFEDVGSTAVPGMTAKPIIDIDIVIDIENLDPVITALAGIGYVHTGDNGIPGREAFDLLNVEYATKLPPHHLYVCGRESLELRRHIAFRNFLKQSQEWREKLSVHKRELCEKFDNNRQGYIDGKADMVAEITRLALEFIDG